MYGSDDAMEYNATVEKSTVYSVDLIGYFPHDAAWLRFLFHYFPSPHCQNFEQILRQRYFASMAKSNSVSHGAWVCS
jgi:hypothetical protein